LLFEVFDRSALRPTVRRYGLVWSLVWLTRTLCPHPSDLRGLFPLVFSGFFICPRFKAFQELLRRRVFPTGEASCKV